MRPLLISVLCSATALGADALRFADVAAWSTWDMPYGLVEFGDAGQLQLVKYRKDINAVANAPLFTHGTRSRGEAVAGGIWKAGSNPDAAESDHRRRPEPPSGKRHPTTPLTTGSCRSI